MAVTIIATLTEPTPAYGSITHDQLGALSSSYLCEKRPRIKVRHTEATNEKIGTVERDKPSTRPIAWSKFGPIEIPYATMKPTGCSGQNGLLTVPSTVTHKVRCNEKTKQIHRNGSDVALRFAFSTRGVGNKPGHALQANEDEDSNSHTKSFSKASL